MSNQGTSVVRSSGSMSMRIRRGSRLSKCSMPEILNSRDALGRLMEFLEARNLDHLLRFYLDAESFRASAVSRLQSANVGIHRTSLAKSSLHSQSVEDLTLSVAGSSTEGLPLCPVADSSVSAKTRSLDRRSQGFKLTDSAYGSSEVSPLSMTSTATSNPADGAMDGSSLGLLNGGSAASSGTDGSEPSKRAVVNSISTGNIASQGASTLKEKLHKSIEHDAITIYSKYIAIDASRPISVPSSLRNETISAICPESGNVDPECFAGCQAFCMDLIEKQSLAEFLSSVHYMKHQLNLLTSGQLELSDVLYNETALFYFMEFMEQNETQGAMRLLQFWLAADNFRSNLVHRQGTYDPMEAQSDAMVLYEKYFSLQATSALGFEDPVRQEVECNICRESGPLPDCFSYAQRLAYKTMDEVYFKEFVQGHIYYRYTTELIKSIQTCRDLRQNSPTNSRKNRRSGSDLADASAGGGGGGSEHSCGSDRSHSTSAHTTSTESHQHHHSCQQHQSRPSSRNTLLAAADSTAKCAHAGSQNAMAAARMRRALNGYTGDMLIDSAEFLHPDSLWSRPQQSVRLGRVNEYGDYVSEFTPEPLSKKQGPGKKKKSRKQVEQEEMAQQVAQMIIRDITATTAAGTTEVNNARGSMGSSSSANPQPGSKRVNR